jgi:hypothetical protein
MLLSLLRNQPSTSNVTLFVRVAGVWKVATLWVRDSGVWKIATLSVNSLGTWKT